MLPNARFPYYVACLLSAVALCLATARCSSDSTTSTPSPNGGHAGEAPIGAAGEPNGGNSGAPNGNGGAAGQSEPADVIPDLNGCTTATYEDFGAADATRTIGIATMGLSFTPKCMTIRVGQTVRWEGSLATHPLAPGNPDHPDAGSPNSPITETTTGSSAEFTFDSAGTFPYYCEVHSFGAGMGMAGAVHVQP